MVRAYEEFNKVSLMIWDARKIVFGQSQNAIVS